MRVVDVVGGLNPSFRTVAVDQVEELGLHVAFGDRARRLDQPIGERGFSVVDMRHDGLRHMRLRAQRCLRCPPVGVGRYSNVDVRRSTPLELEGEAKPTVYTQKTSLSPTGTRVSGEGCPLPKIMELKGVTFEFDKIRLRPDAQTILDWATEILKKYPDMQVEIAGHTDSIGTDEYNQQLSEGRAQAVKQYFIDHGIPEGQMSVKGYGESEPRDTNDTAEGRERNRRVELRILN